MRPARLTSHFLHTLLLVECCLLHVGRGAVVEDIQYILPNVVKATQNTVPEGGAGEFLSAEECIGYWGLCGPQDVYRRC